MAHLIGGLAPYLGTDNLIIGTADRDIIFGDRYTTSNPFGVPEIGGLLEGQGGDDWLVGLGGDDDLVGDAWVIAPGGRGGNDRRRLRKRHPPRRWLRRR